MNVSSYYRQQGATLLISLVMLLIITLLGVTSMRGVALEERIVGNLRDRQTASDGAEAALREGEKRIALSVGQPSVTGTCTGAVGLCLLAAPSAGLISDNWSWWTAAANAVQYQGSAAGLTALYMPTQPYWYAALIGYDPPNSNGMVEVTDTNERQAGIGPYFYQVNAASHGRTARVMVGLQSTTVQRY
jgi:type IV pilus assembly protein PilX